MACNAAASVQTTRGRCDMLRVHQDLVIDDSHVFGGLEVACWPLVPKFAGSKPAESVGFLG